MSNTMNKFAWGLTSLVAALAWAIGCESAIESEVGVGGAEPVPADGFLGSPCRACLRLACDASWSACLSDPECAAHLNCVDECDVDDSGGPDPLCEYGCPAPVGEVGRAALEALASCRLEGQGVECEACGAIDVSLPDALTQSCAPSTSGTPLTQCMQSHCCESIATCFASNAPCNDVIECENACESSLDNIRCELECWRNDLPGAAQWAEFVTCGSYHCVEELGVEEPPCLTCERNECTNSWAACQLDVSCNILFTCLGLCYGAEASCPDACFAEAPASAIAIFEAAELCRDARCIGPCAEGA